MKKIALPLLILLAGPAAFAQVEDTVANVNGKALMLSEYKKELLNVVQQYKQNAPMVLEDPEKLQKIKQQVLDDMIDKSLLSQEAEKKKVKVYSRELESGVKEVRERFRKDDDGRVLTDEQLDTAFAAELKRQGLTYPQFEDRIKRDLSIRKFVNEAIRPEVKAPQDKDIHDFFDKVKSVVDGDTSTLKSMSEQEAGELMTLARQLHDLTSERVRARHILIRVPRDAKPSERNEALTKIQKLKKDIDGGADFADLAKKNSQDPESAARGGDLGYIVGGMTVPEFEKAAFALNVGQVSDIVETPFGFHLILVEEKRAPHKLAYDDVKDDLAQFLFGQRLQRKLEGKVKELRTVATIETFLPKDNAALGIDTTKKAEAPAPKAEQKDAPAPTPAKK